jgi:DNA processing protein
MTTAPLLAPTERLAWLRLARSENVGPITFHQLVARFGTATAALEALPEIVRRGGRAKPLAIASISEAEREMEAVERLGARLIARGEPDYPPALAAIDDAPPLLTVFGHVELAARRGVAIVGARNASANGRRFAHDMGADLGKAGLLVISGLARGIDAAAHQGSLATGTLAVLAGGIDAVYPEENRSLHEAIAERGLLVAEMPIGIVPQARHFPRRNRIISGIALGVLVVEAAERSGSLITARFALEQGREVFAVPGSPLDPRSKGTNRLIRDGATLVESAEDILSELGSQLGPPQSERRHATFLPAPAAEIGAKDLDKAREVVLGLLSPAPLAVDELLRQCQMSPAVILTIVLELELAGRVARQPGNTLTLL